MTTDTALALLAEANKILEQIRTTDILLADGDPNITDRITVLLDSGGWISVKDRLPEKNTTVQVYCDWVDVATYEPKHKRLKSHKWFQEPAGVNPNLNVTHWQPLPPLPKGEIK